MRGAALAVTLSAAAATWATTLHPVVAGLTLAVGGIAALSWNGLALATAVEMVGTARSGLATGFLNTVLSIAATIASPIFAVVVAHSTWQVGFAMLAGCGLVALLTLRGLRIPPAENAEDVAAVALAAETLP
jgi:sugar phosphate permease